MRTIILILIMGIFNSLFGSKANGQTNELIELTSNQDEEEGWQDLIFTVTHKELQNDGYWNITCKATYKRSVVGFRIFILEGIEAGIVNDDLDNTKFIRDAIRIEGIGEESDRLVNIMSQLYGQETVTKFTDEQLTYVAFPLNRDKANLQDGVFKFKLFFDDNNERELYSEFYLNPNFPNGTIELNEKDEEYRTNIIKHLCK